MARCSGECKRQVFRTRRWRNLNQAQDPANPAACNNLANPQVAAIVAAARAELEKEEILGTPCTPAADCTCNYGEVDWPRAWETGKLTRPHTVGLCKYVITADYQIQTKIETGGCVSIKYASRVSASIPEIGVELAMEGSEAISPDDLKGIERILT